MPTNLFELSMCIQQAIVCGWMMIIDVVNYFPTSYFSHPKSASDTTAKDYVLNAGLAEISKGLFSDYLCEI